MRWQLTFTMRGGSFIQVNKSPSASRGWISRQRSLLLRPIRHRLRRFSIASSALPPLSSSSFRSSAECAPPPPMRRQCTTSSTPPQDSVQSSRIAVSRRWGRGCGNLATTATGAVNALDCVDGRGIAGATTTEDPATTMSKQSVGSRGRGGDDDDVFDPRGNGDNDTTISLAMATATTVAGDEEGDGGKSDDDDTPTSLATATATATRSGGRRRVR